VVDRARLESNSGEAHRAVQHRIKLLLRRLRTPLALFSRNRRAGLRRQAHGLKRVIARESLRYESEAAFSRAFKRFVAISPGAARRREPRALHNAAVLPKR
jgi:hypothetical protein